jgi:hypothetical protein
LTKFREGYYGIGMLFDSERHRLTLDTNEVGIFNTAMHAPELLAEPDVDWGVADPYLQTVRDASQAEVLGILTEELAPAGIEALPGVAILLPDDPRHTRYHVPLALGVLANRELESRRSLLAKAPELAQRPTAQQALEARQRLVDGLDGVVSDPEAEVHRIHIPGRPSYSRIVASPTEDF